MSDARVIFSTGSLYPFDVAQCFALAAEAGFDGIELMCDDRYSTRDPHYLRQLMQTYNLPILVVHTPFSKRLMGWNGAQTNEVKRILATLELAEQLEAEAIVVHVPRKIGFGTLNLGNRSVRFPWFSPFGGVRDWIRFELPTLQPRTGVKIALENMPLAHYAGREFDATWWNEIETWSQIHNWLTLDTAHWATKSINPTRAFCAAPERVCHIHLSNYDGREHRLPHRGYLDLGNFLRTLVSEGFNGTVSTELSPEALEYTDPQALRRNLQESLAFCRKHLSPSSVRLL